MTEQERPDALQMTDANEYPLVALKTIVAFPHNRQTLVIASEKTVRAIEDAMMRPDRKLVASTRRSVDIDDPQPKDIFSVGTLAEVKTMHRQQDGGIQVLISGLSRVKIEEYVDTDPFFRVRVTLQPELLSHGPQAEALVRHATSLFERYAQLNRHFSVEDIDSIVALKTPSRLADTLGAHLVTKMEQQQDLLETFDPMERLEKICVIIGNEIEILELETTIRSRVRSQVDRSQKEYYLREQLRAIQEELGIEALSEADELRTKLKEKDLPPDVALKVYKEIDRLERTPQQSAELTVIRSYIDWVLALPWTERTQDRFDLVETRRILDEEHYGLEGIKERIIDFLAVRQLRLQAAQRDGQMKSESLGQILCLIGPPGVGKTSLAQSIARALGRKLARISLGGVHDEAEIRGHRRTYVGALPGRVIQSMKTVGVRNPVFLLDEIDKLSSEHRGDPSAALLEVLDPQQNHLFGDHYLEMPFDLSEVFFICTGNVKYQIPRPLADRMDIIDLPGYMLDEKINIGQRHLWPKVLREHGLSSEQVKITQPVMQRIITDYTREAGIRNLDRQLATICRKAARKILEKPNVPVRITAHNLEQYLGVARYSSTPPVPRTQIGTAMGLAVTEMGGILLPVEVVTMVGKGEWFITGQLGDVMRESVIAALSYIRSRASELQIDPAFQESIDLHIHLPENAIPKDGPSAGITIAIALISVLSKRPVRNNLAMTGEVTLLGHVLGIGGLRDKVLAAQQSNIQTVIIPMANKKDLADIPTKVRQQINLIPVENMDQVIERALLPVQVRSEEPLSPEQPEPYSPQQEQHHRDEKSSHRENGDSVDLDNSPPLVLPPDQANHDHYPPARAKRKNG
jgi:ATP-dependent Lon protease